MLEIDINADGSVTVAPSNLVPSPSGTPGYPNATGGPSVVTVTPFQAPSTPGIPEPSTLALVGLGLASVWGTRRFRTAKAK